MTSARAAAKAIRDQAFNIVNKALTCILPSEGRKSIVDARDAIRGLTLPAERERVLHKKRGSTYRVVGEAALQSSRPVEEGETLVIYEREADQALYARPLYEFRDGRFETLEVSPLSDLDLALSPGQKRQLDEALQFQNALVELLGEPNEKFEPWALREVKRMQAQLTALKDAESVLRDVAYPDGAMLNGHSAQRAARAYFDRLGAAAHQRAPT